MLFEDLLDFDLLFEGLLDFPHFPDFDDLQFVEGLLDGILDSVLDAENEGSVEALLDGIFDTVFVGENEGRKVGHSQVLRRAGVVVSWKQNEVMVEKWH